MKKIAIIGGGFSGAMLGLNLIEQGCRQEIHVIEPRPSLGLGVAYSTNEPGHLLNVAASNMSAWSDRPHDFIGYLIDKKPKLAFQPMEFFQSYYAPRMSYGCYVQSLIRRPQYASLIHHQAQVLRVSRSYKGLALNLSNSERLEADVAVLAVGLPPSGAMDRIFGWAPAGLYLSQPWDAREAEAFLANIKPSDDVLIIGSGLSMIDMLVSLKQRGHRGRVFIISRHGQVPQVHAPFDRLQALDIKERSPLGLLKRFREHPDAWRALFDALRPHTRELWQQFSLQHKAQFLRHLRPFWDSHRHRVAPHIHQVFSAGLKEKRFFLYAGRLLRAETGPDGFNLSFALADNEILRLRPERVINCTGPESQVINFKGPLFSSLLKDGLLRPDPTGLGVLSSPHYQAVQQPGYEPSPLFVLGALRRGTHWECSAVPELRCDAARLAHLLVS